jgi:tetratricopeptide (TPR) repeat protein
MQRFEKLGMLFLVVLLFFFQMTSMGQNKKSFVITGKITAEVQSNGNGVIEVAKTGGGVSKVDVPKNGRFRLELEYFNEFTLTFKVPGNFSKTIIVSTEIPQDVWDRDNDFPPYPMVVQLVKEVEGVDKSLTLKPTGKIFYSKQTDLFEKESLVTDNQLAEQVNNAQKQSGQLKKEEQIINKQEAQDLAVKQKSYDQTIGDADALFKKGEYLNAMLKYQDAKKLFPEKPYANDRIAEIQDLVKALENTGKQKAELEQKYKDAIARANGLFDKKSFQEAKPGYEEALQYKPADSYATAKISEIEKLIAAQGKQKQFDDLIAQADNNYKAKKLDQALTLYTQAKQLIPDNEYPQNQINLINQQKQELAKADQMEKDYQALIAQADKSLGGKDYANAKTGYQKAVALKPAESYPAGKLKEIEQILQQEQQARQVEENYISIIAKADKAFNAKSYEEAKKAYGDALSVKPSEAYPTEQITKIDGLLAEKAKQQQTDNDFMALTSKADAAFNIKDYEGARTIYTNALTLKPNASEVKARIKNIDDILQKLAADKKKEEDRQLALAKEKEKAYNTAINQANKNVTDKRYDDAVSKYQEALQYMPDADYPKQQITRLEALLAQADTERKREESYNAAIKEAETLFTGKDYQASRLSFVKAAELKPAEQLPVRRIKDIDRLLSELALQQAKEKALETNYEETVKRADQAFDAKEYASARTIYGEASSLKPSEQYPKDKIARIDQLLADATLQQYKDAIAAADQAFKADQLDEASSKYELALTHKANDQYAKKQLAEVAKRKTALLDEQNRLRKLEEQYALLMTDALNIFNNKEYEKAKDKYKQALDIKPQESLPKDQIAKIDALLNELRNQEEINRLYTASMATADKAFGQKKLKESRDAYQAALGYKPKEPIPAQHIAEIDSLIAKQENDAKLAAQEEADRLAKEKASKDQYDKAIVQADQAFADKQYPQANSYYTSALSVFPSEKYPKDQITKIAELIAKQENDAKLSAQAEADRLAKEKASKDQYDKAIAQADQAFADKQYPQANTYYTNALGIFPSEKYPKDQITKIAELIAEQENDAKLVAQAEADRLAKEKQDKEREAAAAKESLQRKANAEPVIASSGSSGPVTQITEATGASFRTVSNYDEAIKKADDAFGIKDYNVARFFYNKAIDLKPGEVYPVNQVELIRKLVDSQMSAIDRTGYDNIIKQADEAFDKKNYSVSKFHYYKALEVKSWEKYPKDRIHEILVLTNSLLSEKEEQEYNGYLAKADEALAVKDISIARFYYNKAIAMKQNEEYPLIKLKDIQKMQAEDKQSQKDTEYNKLIEQADQAMQAENYSTARFNYNKALNMRPNEQYPKDQLRKIRELMNKTSK